MLVLSRRVNESIIIGDDIVFTIKSINGNYVRLGIDAPLDLRIYREEVMKKKNVDNKTDSDNTFS